MLNKDAKQFLVVKILFKKYEGVFKRAEELKEKIIDFRRHFHENPELGLEEFGTAKKVAEVLDELGIRTRVLVNGTGVVGFLEGSKPGKTIALRADMDALPIKEENEVPYKSKREGVMHACGHDAHTAMLLGAATILSELKGELEGNVVFIFQPAEETGEGAKRMVEEGALEGVDAIVGIHAWANLETGKLGLRSGPFMAAGDFFEAKIIGKGGHGALPHYAVDPIVIASNVISALQTVISREVDTLETAVVSVCKIEGGKAYNVIPDSVVFGGTIRTHSTQLRDKLPTRVEEIIRNVTAGMRAKYEFNLMRKFPVTICDEGMTRFVEELAKDLLGEDKVVEQKPLMGSEDFSYYLEKVPGTFLFLGTRNEEKGIVHPHHNPKFDVDEDALPLGAALEAAIALEYLGH